MDNLIYTVLLVAIVYALLSIRDELQRIADKAEE